MCLILSNNIFHEGSLSDNILKCALLKNNKHDGKQATKKWLRVVFQWKENPFPYSLKL